tara:strand:+ start:272 stop:676 length:405 start_codon:yes stop_codon:yes gene_type:complete
MTFDFDLFNLLPNDIIKYIKDFLSSRQLALTNKNDWKIYFKYRIDNRRSVWSNKPTISTYIRFIILNKLSFIFGNYIKLINPLFLRHWKTSSYKYNKKKYKNYFDFLKWYSRKNNSTKCLNLILAFEKDIKNRK